MLQRVPRHLLLLRSSTSTFTRSSTAATLRQQLVTLDRQAPFSSSFSTSCVSRSSRARSIAIRPRLFHSSAPTCKGLSPESEDPEPPNNDQGPGGPVHVPEPATLTTDEYHDIADQYIDTLVLKLEEMAEEVSEKLEVEYSAGVLSLSTQQGDYVLNKQPPNKQIWLSSPISGPKRYDWVISGDHHHEKEGTETGGGEWIYLRDGSNLSDLLRKEVGVDMQEGVEIGREGPGSRGA